jgi:hypothetical protein
MIETNFKNKYTLFFTSMVNIPSVTLKKCYFDFGSIIETTHIVEKMDGTFK